MCGGSKSTFVRVHKGLEVSCVVEVRVPLYVCIKGRGLMCGGSKSTFVRLHKGLEVSCVVEVRVPLYVCIKG